MTTTEMTADLEGLQDRLAELEERHTLAVEKVAEARQERAEASAADPGTYHPDLAAQVDAAESERDALRDALEVIRKEIAAAEARLAKAEEKEGRERAERLKGEAVAAWEALDAEFMKHAPHLLELHDAAQRLSAEASRAAGSSWGLPLEGTVPGLAYTMKHARPYLSGDTRGLFDQPRHRKTQPEPAPEAEVDHECDEVAEPAASQPITSDSTHLTPGGEWLWP